MADVVTEPRFTRTVQLINPGEPEAVETVAEVWQTGAGEFDDEGTLRADYAAMFPAGTLVKPLAEVLDVAADRWLWVSGLPAPMASLLTGLADHIEVPLKTIHRIETLIDVLRDAVATDRNDRGDLVETDGPPVAAGVTGAITETTQQVPTTAGELRTVTVLVGWLPAGTDVQPGDRIRDAAGRIYGVEAVTQPLRTGLLDLRLDLVRTT